MDNTTTQQSLDIITLQNVDADPFHVVYDGKSWGLIQPGQFRRLPRFLAEHVVKHLVDQILNRLEKPTSNLSMRREWAAKIVVEEEAAYTPAELSPEEKLQRNIAEMNRESDLENVLNRNKQREAQNAAALAGVPDAQPLPPIDLVDHETPAPPVEPAVLNTETLPVSEVTSSPQVVEDTPPVDTTGQEMVENGGVPEVEAPAIVEEVPEGMPDRQTLYQWATDKMHMDLNDKKTKAALDATAISQLVEDLQYEEGV